jgi:hypothetical protein
MATDNKQISASHFSLSDNFFQLVENVLTQTIIHKNVDSYFGEPRDDIREHYREITKWSDFRIFIPVLFNFFHGIELLLKGANYKLVLTQKQQHHKLSFLYSEFKTNYPDMIKIAVILEKYIFPNQLNCKILNDFYQLNGINDSSRFYESFKYPADKSLDKIFNYMELKNLKDEGINFFKQIIMDIEILRSESEKI